MVSTTASSPAGPPTRLQGTTGGSRHAVGWAGSETSHYLPTFKSQGIPEKIQILSFSWKTRRHGDSGLTSASGKDQQAERGAVAHVTTLLLTPTSQPTPPWLALTPGVAAVPSSEQPRKSAARRPGSHPVPCPKLPVQDKHSAGTKSQWPPPGQGAERPAASPDRDFLCHLRSHFLNLPETELF